MIGLAPKRKPPRSAGPKGDLDCRRWVVITVRNNGANEAQFPLPVTHNGERISFGRDEPVIAPAYFLDTVDNCILPKHELVESTDTTQSAGSRVKSEDNAVMLELKYHIDVAEIEDKFQTVETIQDFARMVMDNDCPEEFLYFKGARFGQSSFNKHNYDWSDLMKKKLKSKPQKPGGKTSGGDSDDQ